MMALRVIVVAAMLMVGQRQAEAQAQARSPVDEPTLAARKSAGPAAVAPADADAEAAVRRADDAYWGAYNRADPVAMNAFLADDVEFYHDRGGTLIGKRALAGANDGMATSAHKLRREAVAGTVTFAPMRKNDVLYGYLASGEHRFIVVPKDKPEFLAGRALFTQLWVWRDKQWKLSRIFSYEHANAP
ncbi:MAG TPA: nuclear transport factor 2 family protein [Duganella sp.]